MKLPAPESTSKRWHGPGVITSAGSQQAPTTILFSIHDYGPEKATQQCQTNMVTLRQASLIKDTSLLFSLPSFSFLAWGCDHAHFELEQSVMLLLASTGSPVQDRGSISLSIAGYRGSPAGDGSMLHSLEQARAALAWVAQPAVRHLHAHMQA